MNVIPTARRVAMVIAVSLAAAASLTACGPPDYNALGTVFDKSMHDGCVSTASKNNPAALAEAYCSCVVTQLDLVPPQQRIGLNASSPQVTTAMTTCNAQVQTAPATNDTTVPPANDTPAAPTNAE